MSAIHRISRPKSKKIKTQADIVFCIDVTGSMKPCIDGVKNGIYTFVEGLQSAADMDFRLRLIAYRDLHDPTAASDAPWKRTPFLSTVEEFRKELSGVTASGGGDYRGAESTLDALYEAVRSSWRASGAHKTIILLTDDNTHMRLHPTTYESPDSDIYRVIQEFQTLKHVMLFMVLPDYPAYRQIDNSMTDADRKVITEFVPRDDERFKGLQAIEWEPLLRMIGQTVSQTSVKVAIESGS